MPTRIESLHKFYGALQVTKTIWLFLFALIETACLAWLTSYLLLPDQNLPYMALRLGIGAAIMIHTLFLAKKNSSGALLMGGIVGFIVYVLTVIVAFVPRA